MTPHTPYSMLLASVKDHRMTVLRDDGLYRHVRFQKPGTSIWHFDLVTWPGHLVITGDLQDFHFARISDMFEFFRTKQLGEINESYWGEKLRGPVKTKSFSAERYKQCVYEHFRYFCEYDDSPHADIWKAIREELLDDAHLLDEHEAHRRLQDFRYVRVRDGIKRTIFEFTDSWEWDLREWDWHFRLSLHAIVWGIRQWDIQPHHSEAHWLREDLKKVRDYLKSLGDDEKGHIVRFSDESLFNAQHPLHERVGNQLLDCVIHEEINRFVADNIVAPGSTWRVIHRDHVKGEEANEWPYLWEKIE